MQILQVDTNADHLQKINKLFSSTENCIIHCDKNFLTVAKGISFDVILYNPQTAGQCPVEFIKEMQSYRFHTPIILFTSEANSALLSLGAVGVVNLSMSDEEVLAVVHKTAKFKRP